MNECSRKYFWPIKEIIKREFRVKHPLQGQNLSIAKKIRNTNSVCLHIRNYGLVDSEVNSKVSNKYELLGLDYYYNALNYLQSKENGLHCFVFSDNPEWARQYLQLSCPCTIVAHNHTNSGREYEDLRLMSMCKHYIIANSTFSWWGAWMGDHKGKLVIAPMRWYKNLKVKTEYLYPENWKLMD